MPATPCAVLRLGMVEYQPAWQLQDQMAAQVADGTRLPTLLLLEHPHTYTFGRSAHAENLLWDEEELTRRGVGLHWVDRGGDVTYHGPGQLVGYPILPLGTPKAEQLTPAGSLHLPQADYVGYLRRLEQVLINAVAALGLPSQRVEGLTGVWVRLPSAELAKLAAIGVKVDARGISRHGFALNVSPDMSYWQGIIACGLAGYPLTSLAELLPTPPAMQAVIEAVTRSFGTVFGYEMVSQDGLV